VRCEKQLRQNKKYAAFHHTLAPSVLLALAALTLSANGNICGNHCFIHSQVLLCSGAELSVYGNFKAAWAFIAFHFIREREKYDNISVGNCFSFVTLKHVVSYCVEDSLFLFM
jgi:hypothetical protein